MRVRCGLAQAWSQTTNDPDRRGPSADAKVPRRQPRSRRIRALEAESAHDAVAPDAGPIARPGDHRSRASRPGRAGPAAGAAGRRRRRQPARPEPARDRADRPRRRARPGAWVRARLRRLLGQAVQLPRAAGADRGGARPGPAPARLEPAAGRPARDRSAEPAASSSTASRSSCPRRSSRCCGRWPRSRPGCSRARNCCAACGASGHWARRGPRTRTPRGCAGSWAAPAAAFVVNVWGVGYRLIEAGLD